MIRRTRTGRLTIRRGGTRANADAFRWLLRIVTGTPRPHRGTIDARTGAITLFAKGGSR